MVHLPQNGIPLVLTRQVGLLRFLEKVYGPFASGLGEHLAEEIGKYAPANVNIMLVGTKKDMVSKRVAPSWKSDMGLVELRNVAVRSPNPSPLQAPKKEIGIAKNNILLLEQPTFCLGFAHACVCLLFLALSWGGGSHLGTALFSVHALSGLSFMQGILLCDVISRLDWNCVSRSPYISL